MTPPYRIADDAVLLVHGRKVVVLVDEETGTRQAFYQSKGKCGGSVQGQWVPFYGFDFVPQFGGTYFVKHPDGKTFELDSAFGQMAAWLATQDLEVTYESTTHVWWHCRSLAQQLELLDEIVQLNAQLNFMGAPDREDEPRLTRRRAKQIAERLR